MLESLVATVLNRVVGSYVENFDPKQLNIGLLSGDVKLSGLKMKKSALDKLHLPVKVTEGEIGSLILQIPYSNLKNKPVKILIEDVLVKASPELHPDESDYNRRMQAAKRDKLELWEVSQEAKPDVDPNAPETSSFITKIIDNVQVTIKNIHLRYEDVECVPEHPFAMGITLSELSAVSTTKDWEPAFISEVTNISHKLATLDSFSIYWDSDAKPMSVHEEEFTERITDCTGRYVLRPVNGQGYITLNKRPNSESTPKIDADLQFEEIAMGLESAQYRDLLAVADQFQLFFRTREYRQYRPKVSVKEDPKAWWKYAANTVLKNIQEKSKVWNTDNFNQRMKDMKEYIALYQKQYSTPLSADEKVKYNEIEDRYSFDDLVLFRSLAKYQLKTRPKPRQEAKQTWTSWLWGSPAEKNAENPDETDGPVEITEKQKQEFMDIFDEPDRNVTLNQILLSAKVALQSGSVRLKYSAQEDVAALLFNTLKANVIQRSDNLLFGLSLDSFEISDLYPDSKFPDVVRAFPRKQAKQIVAQQAQREGRDGADQIFWLMFENRPLDGSADSTLSLKSQSVKVLYSALFVERLVQFFAPPERSFAVDAIVDAATRTVEELREQTRLGLEYALVNHRSLLVKLDIDAPIIVVPENPSNADSGVLVLDTGHLSLESELAPKNVLEEVKSKQKLEKQDWEKLKDLMFDKFRVTLEDAQILIGPHFQSTVELIESNEPSIYRLLDKSTFDFLLMVSIVPTVATIPRCKVNMDLSKLSISFADVQYKQLMRTIQSAVPHTNTANVEDEERPVLHQRPANAPVKDRTNVSQAAQVLFELSFNVKQAELMVCRGWNGDKIASICLHSFLLGFKKNNEAMTVGLTVDDLLIEDFINEQAPPDLRKFIESAGGHGNGDNTSKLLTVNYKQIEGSNSSGTSQNVDVELASMKFIINPNTVLTVYDYIMSTFTSPDASTPPSQQDTTASALPQSSDTINVAISLKSIVAQINEDNVIINTLELASARMTVNLLGEYLKFHCVLGAVSIIDEVNRGADPNSAIRHLLGIEGGGDLAEIKYETVPTDEYDAYVYFRSGSLKLSMVEEPVAQLLCSLSRLLQMKAVYDQARMIAFDQAQNFDPPERIKLDVVLKAPIIVFPRYHNGKLEQFTANLGEIFVQNNFDNNTVQDLTAGFRNLHVSTDLWSEGEMQHLAVVGDVDLQFNASIDKAATPSVKGSGKLDAVTIDVTQNQYQLMMQCVDTVSQIMSKVSGLDKDEVGNLRQQLVTQKNLGETTQWELPAVAQTVETIDFGFEAPGCNLKLYSGTAGTKDPTSRELSLFKLDSTTIKVKSDEKKNLAVDVSIKAFTVEDLRSSTHNKFPEVIPPSGHDDCQFRCRYTQSPDRTPNLDISLDGLKLLLAVDYLLALQKFAVIAPTAPGPDKDFSNEFPESLQEDREGQEGEESDHDELVEAESPDNGTIASPRSAEPSGHSINVNCSIVDMYLFILADASRKDTEAVVFKVEHIVGSLGKNSSLAISKVGMYLTQMHNESQQLRLLDDFNITASAEDIESSQEAHITKVNAHVDPFVFRVSLSEVQLAIAIFNRASALWASSHAAEPNPAKFSNYTLDGKPLKSHKSIKSGTRSRSGSRSQQRRSPLPPRGSPVRILGEQMQLETSGFRAVIIDTNHIPMADFVIKPFDIRVHNWSSDLSADGNLEFYSNFYSFSKSAWEPLCDQATVFFHMSKPNAEQAPVVNVQCKDVANFDITTELIDLVDKLQTYFSQDPETIFCKNRFEDGQPYRIVNQTGYDMKVWSETADSSASLRSASTVKNGDTVPWAFYDWRKVREALGGVSQQVSLGIELDSSPFDPLHNVCVNMIGEHLYVLKPHRNTQSRLAVEISVKDSVKYVVFRSTVCVANETQVPLDVRLVLQDYTHERTVAAGERFSAPILDVDAEIYVKPTKGNYGWSTESIWWRRLRKKEYGVECPGENESFYVHAAPYYPQDIPLPNHYPYMIINLVAPVELINNLPFDCEYRLFCQNTNVDWKNTIKKGERYQVHVVSRSQLLLLSVDCDEYTSDPAIVNSRVPDFNVEHRMQLHSKKSSHRLKLDIRYVDLPQNKGTSIVILASYVLINRVGKKLTVATKLNSVECGVEHSADENEWSVCKPYMWSFEHPDNHNKATLKIDDSLYTQPINFTAIGTTSEVAVPSRNRHREMHLGVSLSEGEGRYKRTNIVNIAPRYIIFNKTDVPIMYKEPGEVEVLNTLQPGTFEPVGFISNICNRQMCLSFTGQQSKWSSAFVMSNVGTCYVRLIQDGKPTVLIKAEIVLEDSTLFIYLSKSRNWPYSIRNLSDLDFEFYQANPYVDEHGIERRSFTPTKYRLPPYTAMPYSWDFPAANLKELVLCCGSQERKVQLAEIGELEPVDFTDADGHPYPTDLNVIANGPLQALVITPFTNETSNYDLVQTTSATTAHTAQTAQTDTTTTRKKHKKFEISEQDDSKSAFHLQVEIEGIGISYINRNNIEFCYAIMRNITLVYRLSDLYEYYAVRCQWIQIDNSLSADTSFPVMVFPTVLPRNGDEIKQHPVFSAAVTRLNDDSYGLRYFKHATVLLQEMTVDLDEDILVSLLQLVRHPSEGELLHTDNSTLCPPKQMIPQPPEDYEKRDMYFEVFHLQPIQLNVSFVRTGALSETDLFGSLNGGIGYVLDAASMAIANIDDAPIKMNAIMIENLRTTQEHLQSCIQTHYTQELLYQLYKVVGSADLFGNPVGLWNNLSSGFMDLFYEPYMGYTATDRPQDIGIGIAKGGAMFFKKSVYGISNSVSKLTGSVSKGLLAVTLDPRYQRKQRAARIRNKPGNALYGFGYGASSLATSLYSGISGLALAPLEGATAEGASGFFKGMGKGIVGLPTKTAIGMLEFASNLSEGVRNNTTVFDNNTIMRTRPSRVIARDTIVRPYNERDAIGQQLLHTMRDGKYKRDEYLAHTQLANGEFIIVSYQHILCLRLQGLREQWSLTYSELKSVALESKGIAFKLRGDVRGPFIPIPEQDTRKYLVNCIGQAVTAYNQEKATLA